jgi:hypothetical protein
MLVRRNANHNPRPSVRCGDSPNNMPIAGELASHLRTGPVPPGCCAPIDESMMTCPTPAAPIAAAMFFARQLLSMRTWLETERRRKKDPRSLGATQCALKGRTRNGRALDQASYDFNEG